MNYKVIGWTYYEDDDYPAGQCSQAAFRAIVDEVKKCGYDFSGYSHQEMLDCVPVLNTGERMCFSSRGWGRVMAEAHGHFGVYDYSNYSFGTDESDVLPECDFIREDIILTREKLSEKISLKISDDEFESVLGKGELVIPDTDNVRYIDVLDSVILDCNGRIAEYKVSAVSHGRDRNGGSGKINFISNFEIEEKVYSHDEARTEYMQLYEKGKRAVKITLV